MAATLLSDPRDRDPEVRRERVKLVANGVNALGIAVILGAVLVPLFDPSRTLPVGRTVLGGIAGAAFVIVALFILRYMKPKE